uniref:Uncharacterized protein n=1 Tax=Peronospora matthiolae TaxID=2874970 RepID=A0AAV1TVS7_9STRA
MTAAMKTKKRVLTFIVAAGSAAWGSAVRPVENLRQDGERLRANDHTKEGNVPSRKHISAARKRAEAFNSAAYLSA